MDRLLLNFHHSRIVDLAFNSTFNFKNLSDVKNFLRDEEIALKKRVSLTKSNRIIKLFIALQMLFYNQYKHFNGIRSFFKDIIL